MIYRQTINIERIALSPLNDTNSTNCVELVKFGDTATFGVFADEYFWEFDMSEPSDYERVKMNIYDAIFECDTMKELCEALNAIFEDGFSEILLYDDDEEEFEDEYEDDEVDWADDEKDEDNEADNHSNCGCVMCPFKCKH